MIKKKLFFLIQRAPIFCRGFFLLILFSCASFAPEEFKDPVPWPFRDTPLKNKRSLNVKFFTGKPNWKKDYVPEKDSEQINSGRWRETVLKTLRESHHFQLVEMNWPKADYDVKVYLEEKTDYPPYMGLISSVTLFLIPLRVEMKYKMTFIFSKNRLHKSRRPKEFKVVREGGLYTWIHPFLLPMVAVSSYSKVHGQLVKDLTQKTLIVLREKGDKVL